MSANERQFDSKMEDNIRNYNKRIQTIESFVEAIRKTIGMYAGRRGNRGFKNIIREVYQNSIDELIKTDSPCNWIRVFYNEMDKGVQIEDNGRGIPFDNIVRVFTQQHTSSNYTKNPGEFSSGMNGVGAKVTNALSSKFIVESYVLGEGRRVEFIDGKPWDKGEQILQSVPRYQGTSITFWPSYECLGELTLTPEELFSMIKVILSLTPIGSRVQFDYVRLDGSEHHEEILNEEGIITDLIFKTQSPLIKPIVLKRDILGEQMRAELAFTFDSASLGTEDVTSFANFCPTESGTHVDGLIDGIVTYFRNYMNKIYLVNNKKVTVNASDIKTGLKAVIAVAHIDPIFSGQAKEVLNNEDMAPFVKSLVLEGLENWSKQNPNDLQRLCKYLKDLAEIRLKSETEKVKVQKTYTARSNGDPEKYAKSLKTKTELIIMEGLSAIGSARNSRNKDHQAIYPIQGKIPNALDTPRDKFITNPEISALISIITNGTLKIGKAFNIDDCPWQYIIFCADADPDGAHINSLLLYFIMMYMPALIKAGRVYQAVAPLYITKVGKNNLYFVDNVDLTVYVQNIFLKDNVVTTVDNQRLTKNEITDIFVTLDKYCKRLEQTALNFALDPMVLEFFLINLNDDFKTLKAKAKKEYRFLETNTPFELVNGCPTGSWLYNGRIQNLHLTPIIINQSSEILDMIAKVRNPYYRLNGEVVSLYQLMTAFELKRPKDIKRNKGLGEMEPEELAESTIGMTSARTLIRYTMEESQEQIDRIRYINSNKDSLLKGIKVRAEDID